MDGPPLQYPSPSCLLFISKRASVYVPALIPRWGNEVTSCRLSFLRLLWKNAPDWDSEPEMYFLVCERP